MLQKHIKKTLRLVTIVWALFSCTSTTVTQSNNDTDLRDASSSADTDSDTDADTDSDTDADTDSDTDADTDSDSDTDADTDTGGEDDPLSYSGDPYEGTVDFSKHGESVTLKNDWHNIRSISSTITVPDGIVQKIKAIRVSCKIKGDRKVDELQISLKPPFANDAFGLGLRQGSSSLYNDVSFSTSIDPLWPTDIYIITTTDDPATGIYIPMDGGSFYDLYDQDPSGDWALTLSASWKVYTDGSTFTLEDWQLEISYNI